MVSLTKLFFIFCKIGLIMFGGGAAMLPILKAEIVDKRRYTTSEELLDLYSISQCTPGIIAVNIATFIGHKLRGITGAMIATLGVITPAILIIISIAAILSHFMDNRYVIYAFSGIRIAVIALIVNVVIDLVRAQIKNWIKALIFALSFITMLFLKLSPALLVIIVGISAVVFGEISRKVGKK